MDPENDKTTSVAKKKTNSKTLEKKRKIIKEIARKALEVLDEWEVSPIRILREAIQKKEWYRGVVLSTTFLEFYGLGALEARYYRKIKSERLRHMSLEQIIMFLYASGMITLSTYRDMMGIKRLRNELVHKAWTEFLINPKEAQSLIEKAIEIIKILRSL